MADFESRAQLVLTNDELTERVKKLEIQVNCLRKQVLDIEGKKSYTEEAREYARIRDSEE
jgi:hypothetical protein